MSGWGTVWWGTVRVGTPPTSQNIIMSSAKQKHMTNLNVFQRTYWENFKFRFWHIRFIITTWTKTEGPWLIVVCVGGKARDLCLLMPAAAKLYLDSNYDRCALWIRSTRSSPIKRLCTGRIRSAWVAGNHRSGRAWSVSLGLPTRFLR